MDTLNLIHEYLKRHVDNPPETLLPESRLNEIGLDSLALLELIFELEDRHKITVPNDVPMPETVDQLIKLIEKFKPADLSIPEAVEK